MAGTGKVDINSDLKRLDWVRDKLLIAASVSFWQTYTGASSDALVYQETNISAGAGHTVVFDYSGKATGKAYKGNDQAYGKGEIKRKFSDKISVDEYTIPINNGKKFDGVDIGDLSINEHSDSMSKLGDLWIRWKDQMIFDVAQGVQEEPTHIIDLGTDFTFNNLGDINQVIKTGRGCVKPTAAGAPGTIKAVRRAPLPTWKTQDGQNVNIAFIDTYMASKLKKDDSYRTIMIGGDVRGANNRVIQGLIGKLENVVYVEAPSFFGYADTTSQLGFDDSEIEVAGLRRYKIDAGKKIWEGQKGFEESDGDLYSRGFVLGTGALQVALGKHPDYKFQKDQNFGKTSESAMEFWINAKKTSLSVEAGSDYKAGKIADLDYSIIAIDMKHTA